VDFRARRSSTHDFILQLFSGGVLRKCSAKRATACELPLNSTQAGYLGTLSSFPNITRVDASIVSLTGTGSSEVPDTVCGGMNATESNVFFFVFNCGDRRMRRLVRPQLINDVGQLDSSFRELAHHRRKQSRFGNLFGHFLR